MYLGCVSNKQNFMMLWIIQIHFKEVSRNLGMAGQGRKVLVMKETCNPIRQKNSYLYLELLCIQFGEKIFVLP